MTRDRRSANKAAMNPFDTLRNSDKPSFLDRIRGFIYRKITPSPGGEKKYVWIEADEEYPYPYNQDRILTLSELKRRRHNETLLLSKGFRRCRNTDLFEGRVLIRFKGRLKKDEGARRSLVIKIYPPIRHNPPVIYLPQRYKTRYNCHHVIRKNKGTPYYFCLGRKNQAQHPWDPDKHNVWDAVIELKRYIEDFDRGKDK